MANCVCAGERVSLGYFICAFVWAIICFLCLLRDPECPHTGQNDASKTCACAPQLLEFKEVIRELHIF